VSGGSAAARFVCGVPVLHSLQSQAPREILLLKMTVGEERRREWEFHSLLPLLPANEGAEAVLFQQGFCLLRCGFAGVGAYDNVE